MVRYTDDDSLTENEWPDEDDIGDDDSLVIVPCPECGKMIAEDTQQCPHCRMWITQVTEARRRLRTWLWPVVIGGLIAVILVIWHGLRF